MNTFLSSALPVSRRCSILALLGGLLSQGAYAQSLAKSTALEQQFGRGSVRNKVVENVNTLLGDNTGPYVALGINKAEREPGIDSQAKLVHQFAVAFAVPGPILQTPEGNTIIAGSRLHETSTRAFVLTQGNTVSVLAIAILHKNCNRAAMAQLRGARVRAEDTQCDKVPTLTILHGKSTPIDGPNLDALTASGVAAMREINAWITDDNKVLRKEQMRVEVRPL